MAKILVIDDDKSWASLLSHYLEKFGHEIILANTGNEGLEKLSKESPSLVLCDLAMPHGNGYEFVKSCKSDPKLRSIPVIAVTGSKLINSELEAKSVGFDGMVDKSFDTEDVVVQILKFLAQVEQL